MLASQNCETRNVSCIIRLITSVKKKTRCVGAKIWSYFMGLSVEDGKNQERPKLTINDDLWQQR